MRNYGALLMIGLCLSACQGEREATRPPRKLDPAIVAALNDPIMIDPDLVTQNRGDAVITRGGFDAEPLPIEANESVLASAGD